MPVQPFAILYEDGPPTSPTHPLKVDLRDTHQNVLNRVISVEALQQSAGGTTIPALSARVTETESDIAALQAGQGAATVFVKTWTELNAIVPTVSNLFAEVDISATGTHTDPVVGGTVNNKGIYRSKHTAPIGWERVNDNRAVLVSLTTGGTATAIALTSTPVQAAYSPANEYQFVTTLAATGPATASIDALPAKQMLWEDGSFIDAGDFSAARLLTLRYHTASDTLRIVSPVRRDPSIRLGHYGGQSKLANRSYATPSSRYSAADAGDGFSLTQIVADNFMCSRVYPHYVNPGDTLVAEFVASGTIDTNDGPMVGVSAVYPAADYDAYAAGTVGYLWRQDGTIAAYSEDGITQIQSLGSGPKWAVGDVLRMELYSAAASGGTLALYNNGELAAQFSTSQITYGYAMAGLKGIGPNLTVTVNYAKVRRQDGVAKRFYIKGSAGSSGNGEMGSVPFNTIKDAVVATSGKGRSITYYVKDSLRGSLVIPAGRHDEIRILGDPDQRPSIYASALITSGWVKTAGYTNVYEMTSRWGKKSGTLYTEGALIEVTGGVNHAVGRSGAGQTIPIMPYTRQTPNTSAGTLAAALTTLDGTPSRYLFSTSDGKTYVHARGSVSPNTLSIEYAEHSFCIGIIAGPTADYHAPRVIIENIDCRYSYADAVKVQKANVEINGVRAWGSGVGNGFGLDDCTGSVNGCEAIGNNNDGINHSSVLGTTGFPVPTILNINDLTAKGQRIGDGISNHNGATFNVRGGALIANGKDGIVPADGDATISGTLIQDNVSHGVHCFGLNAKNTTVDVLGCLIQGNDIGIEATASIAVPTRIARVNSRNNHFRNNTAASLRTTVSATYAAFAIIETIDDKTSGAAPSLGHKVPGNGTITTITGAAI